MYILELFCMGWGEAQMERVSAQIFFVPVKTPFFEKKLEPLQLFF